MHDTQLAHLDTVLIIEDDAIIRQMLEVSLERTGDYIVLSAGDGAEGLHLAIDNNPDILVLDLALPGTDGLDLMQELARRNFSIPTIIITAHTDARTIIHAFRLGAKNLLPKPFSVRELQDVVASTLTETHLARQAREHTEALGVAHRSLQRRIRNWEVLNDIAQGMITLTEERDIYRRVLANINRIVDEQATSILLLDETGAYIAQELAVLAPADAESPPPKFRDVRIELEGTVAGRVVSAGTPLLVANTASDPHYRADTGGPPLRPHLSVNESAGGPRRVVCVPLRVQQRTIGVLEVLSRISNGDASAEPPDFMAQDLELVQLLASWVTLAIENVRLSESRQKMAATQTLAQTVVTLAHHVNNQLMICFLELDRLQRSGVPEPTAGAHGGASTLLDSGILTEVTENIHGSLNHIHKVIRGLTRLQDAPTVRYVGGTDMIDLHTILDQD
jgi:DNA-binding response OmpR family regulator